MSFSLATNPPGGVVQASLNDVSTHESLKKLCSNETKICVGTAILGSLDHSGYFAFLVCNTTCFIAALSVIFLLVSGIPMDNSFTIWLLSVGMCITLTSLALTYLFAAIMVTPNTIWNTVGNVFGIALIVWVALVLIVLAIQIVRLFVRGCCKK
ncbi:ankyrin repeat-containing protein BDA1 [Trifolium repens]|nr:ankyrin repeat-containing protein BDA1 [Trifolium repens]KAK2406478.1 ankyrin repeat-containing protein BDA1 [Trifolium repens]KAK2406481.1 ankyrin repeat-containing protein BDA1 [Trifolium repens]KAK2406483.1 ankyrin repeat-containing protein BDA1 [Trifolium repens]KAK2406485.1 ankyrin repeat-containing protein BDA1 [Trifolium repens]